MNSGLKSLSGSKSNADAEPDPDFDPDMVGFIN